MQVFISDSLAKNAYYSQEKAMKLKLKNEFYCINRNGLRFIFLYIPLTLKKYFE